MPRGTYFVTVDIRPLGETDGLAFCRALPERCGVVAVPNVVFYDDEDAGRSLVRFTFCKRREVLEDAVAPAAHVALIARCNTSESTGRIRSASSAFVYATNDTGVVVSSGTSTGSPNGSSTIPPASCRIMAMQMSYG